MHCLFTQYTQCLSKTDTFRVTSGPDQPVATDHCAILDVVYGCWLHDAGAGSTAGNTGGTPAASRAPNTAPLPNPWSGGNASGGGAPAGLGGLAGLGGGLGAMQGLAGGCLHPTTCFGTSSSTTCSIPFLAGCLLHWYWFMGCAAAAGPAGYTKYVCHPQMGLVHGQGDGEGEAEERIWAPCCRCCSSLGCSKPCRA